MNVYDYLLEMSHNDAVAVLSRQGQVTHAELRVEAGRVAFTLARAGVRRGERVGILAENSPFWIACYLGILKAGAVAVPFPARLSTEKLRALAELTGCVALCADAARLRPHAAHLPEQLLVLVDGGAETTTVAARALHLEDGDVPTAEVDERRDLAALMFTSGSTGAPNAVRISHRNIMANTTSIVAYLGLRPDDRIMVVLPFDYCFGLSLLHTHLRAGGSLVLNNASQFAEDVLEDMERFGCTGFAGVPAVYQSLLRRSTLCRRALPALRFVQQAGGKLADALIVEFRAAFPTVRFFVMYGQTEATARLSYLPPERLGDKLGSIGRGLPGTTLRVLDPEGHEVAPGETGEIVAEGDNIASGYWVPDPARQGFRDGRLYTGDLATVDDDGFIFLKGRTSDFIKPSGHRISSKEIEDVLAELPDVVEAAVIGVPDPLFGEAAKAFLVTRDGSELPATRVVEHCRRRLPPYAVPRQVVFVPDLPKTASHKVLKRALA